MKTKLTGVLIALSWMLCPSVHAGETSISIGSKSQLQSHVMDEARPVWVSLPPDYETSQRRYPVLYLLDGSEHFVHVVGLVRFLAATQKIPDLIVVGIPNTHRGRDFSAPDTPEEGMRDPGVPGGAARFARFLRQELVPWVEARYRAEPWRILHGHSSGGLISLYLLANDPGLFNAHIAASPWLGGSPSSLDKVKVTISRLESPTYYFISSGGGESGIEDPARELAAWFGQNAPGRLKWSYQHYPNDTHISTPHRTLLDGLEFVFSDWNFSPFDSQEPVAGAYPRLRALREEMQARYGFEVVPTAGDLSWLGHWLLRMGEAEQASAVAAEAKRLYPRSPENLYLFLMLAEHLQERGRAMEALEAYRQALQAAVWAEEEPDEWFAQRVRGIPRKIEMLEADIR